MPNEIAAECRGSDNQNDATASPLMTPDTREIFQNALALHQRGHLGRAQALYKDVLQRDRNHFDSLHLLGLTHVQSGEPETGVGYIAQAIAVRSDFPEAHYNMGHALLDLNRPADALASFDRALELNPKDPQYHFERGNALKDLGRGDEALLSYETAIRILPGFAEAHNNCGIVLKEAGRFEEALSCYEKALALKRDYAEAFSNRGNVLKELGRLQEAMESFDTAIHLRPNHAETHSNRGNALAQLRLWAEALASHDKAIALKPDYAEAHNNRGIVLKELGRPEEALRSYDEALRLKPGYAEAYSNRGNALKDLQRMDEALESHDRAIALKPDYAEAYINRGNALKDLNRPEEALADYDKASILKPSQRMAQYNRSLIDLQLHSFKQGFDLYRWRWQGDASGAGAPETTIPPWSGSPAGGEVLLWSEQGIGDEVFFTSMLSLLDGFEGAFALSADRRLHPIYERSFPRFRLVDGSETAKRITGDFAAQAPIGDLGHILKVDERKVAERRYPYLVPSVERREQLQSAMRPRTGNLVCGLSWRSGNTKVGAMRSLRLTDLAPVLSVPGVTFVNLQYGDASADIESARHQLGADVRIVDNLDVFKDIDGLLALISLCDVVLTIDNLTSHLAGAIGKDSAVLVPTGGGRHWYWGGESQSLWYPSLKLFYQHEIGEWTAAIAEASQWLARTARK